MELFKEEWDKYIAGINDVQSKVGSLKDKIPTLKLIRDNAQNHSLICYRGLISRWNFILKGTDL